MKEQNVLDTDPRRYIVAGVTVIALFFGGLFIWSVFFPFQGAVVAPGVVKVVGERKVVQHLEGGIIEKILVRDGDEVKKGQVLIELKSSRISSNVDLLEGRLLAKMAEAARLKAQARMEDKITWPKEIVESSSETVEEVKIMETKIFDSTVTDMAGKIKLYRSQIKQLENQAAGAKEELASVETIIKNISDDLESKRPLLKDKYMSKSNILDLEKSLASYRGRKGKLIQDIAQSRQKIEEINFRIMDMKNQYRDQAVSRLGEVSDIIFEVREQLKPQLDAKERLMIRAPISGVVINMRVHSENSGVITPSMPLLEIVPTNTNMIVEARVRPQDIISVKLGQSTKVQLAAFQRKSTPPIEGKVVYVSADLVVPPGASQMTPPYYQVRVTVDQMDLKDKEAYLSPGMPAACYIASDQRSIISYLLSPLLKNVDMALRE